MVMEFSRKQEEHIKNLFDEWSKPLVAEVARLRPLVAEVAKLTYELRKTNNELYKLKDSLVYRNMVTRVTATPERVQQSTQNNRRLIPYLRRSGRKQTGREGKKYDVENSRVISTNQTYDMSQTCKQQHGYIKSD